MLSIGPITNAQNVCESSSTGMSSTSPRTRAGACTATSSAMLAPSDVPPMTARSTPSPSSAPITCRPYSSIECSRRSAGRSESPCPSMSGQITR